MTGVIVGVLVLLTIVLGVTTAHLLAKSHAPTAELGTPDATSEEVMTGLLSELRKWQAEAAHWKATAERLQREIDQRQ